MTWTIGELAKATGLTVRTLHHWDAEGLLVPAERTEAGHRRYSGADVERLYRIVALRRLGLSLRDVAAALEGDGDLRGTVASQLERVEGDLATLERVRLRLRGLLATLDGGEAIDPTELIQTIEVMTMHEQYYSDDQLAQLERRREALGDEGMAQAQRDWAELIESMTAERDRGTPPEDPRVQALAARWQELIDAFTGGDPETAASLKRMYESEGVEAASRGAVDRDLMDYVGRALAARGGG